MRIVTTKENTYGFELEFCTHDNTILRYTHIEIAKIKLKGDALPKNIQFSQNGSLIETYNEIPLKLETDSGDVLELVTPPIIFTKPENAVKFRDDLAAYLKGSVAQPLTLSEWMERYGLYIIPKMAQWYLDVEHNPLALIEADGKWDFIPFAEIALDISVNNIDDGINIAAATYRKNKMDEAQGNSYLGQTVLCASTKDYPEGYSTQTSIPMTERDYVKYVISHKLVKSTANIKRLIALLEGNPNGKVADIDKTLEWDKVEKWVTTWFWGGVIFDIFLVYRNYFKKFLPENPLLAEIKDYSQDSIQKNYKWSEKLGVCGYDIPKIEINDTEAAFFIIVQKTLTGALGGLSEGAQLEKQRRGEASLNTSAMDARSKVRKPDRGQYYWCEYHSSLKDLTGVWFKGHLADVLLHLFGNLSSEWRYELAKGLSFVRPQLQSIYQQRLALAETILGRLKRMTYFPEFIYMKEDGQLNTLIAKHDEIIDKTAWFVSSTEEVWQNAERKQEFLMYSSGNTVWEGRKDTMIRPIYHLKEPSLSYETFFLVEHRNN